MYGNNTVRVDHYVSQTYSVFVIALIWLFKKYKFFVQRLILYLSVAAFLSSIAYILVSQPHCVVG